MDDGANVRAMIDTAVHQHYKTHNNYPSTVFMSSRAWWLLQRDMHRIVCKADDILHYMGFTIYEVPKMQGISVKVSD